MKGLLIKDLYMIKKYCRMLILMVVVFIFVSTGNEGAIFSIYPVVLAGLIFFLLMAWKYNALLSGEATAKTMGVRVEALRFWTLLLSSMITAVCVSFLGIIGFVGVICPHVTKKLLGQDHRITIPVSCLTGSLLLLVADSLSRSLGSGSALPVGAITSLLGAPFFLAIIFGKKEGHHHC